VLLVIPILGILATLPVISLRSYGFPILSPRPRVRARFAPRRELGAIELARQLLQRTRRSAESFAQPDVASLPFRAIIDTRRVSLVRLDPGQLFPRRVRNIPRPSGPVLSVSLRCDLFGVTFDPLVGRGLFPSLDRPLRVRLNTRSRGTRRLLGLRFARVGSDRFAISPTRPDRRHRIEGGEQESRLVPLAFPASFRRRVQRKMVRSLGHAPRSFSRIGYFLGEIGQVT